jgi:importin subunit beta-1
MKAFADNVLTAIVYGLREDESSTRVRLAAVTSLLNSLDFAQKNFHDEQKREVIVEHVRQATQSTEISIKVMALQCLVEIVSLYYHWIDMEPLLPVGLLFLRSLIATHFKIVFEAVKSDEDEVALQGIEFWATICEEEIVLAKEEQKVGLQCTVYY